MPARSIFTSLVLLASLTLTGCGGEENSNSASTPSSGGTVSIEPTPTPSRTPSYNVVAIGSLISVVTMDSDKNGTFSRQNDTVVRTNLSGAFGQGLTAPSSGRYPAVGTTRILAETGIDTATGLIFTGLSAPVGASVISPLSTVIDAGVSEQELRAALGLDTGEQALRPETRILTFNPNTELTNADSRIAADAARLLSANLKLLALAAISKDTNGDPVDYPVPLYESSRYLANTIRATGNGRQSDPAVIRAVLDQSRYGVDKDKSLFTELYDPKMNAASALIAKYNAAMPDRIEDQATARAWAYTFRFYIFPEFKTIALSWPNHEADRIAAITEADITNAAAWFKTISEPVIGNFMAVPDYRELTPTGITHYVLQTKQCNALPSCNDWTVFDGMNSSARVISVSGFDPNKILVTIDAEGLLTVRRANTYSGPAFFYYVSRHETGLETTGVVFITVR